MPARVWCGSVWIVIGSTWVSLASRTLSEYRLQSSWGPFKGSSGEVIIIFNFFFWNTLCWPSPKHLQHLTSPCRDPKYHVICLLHHFELPCSKFSVSAKAHLYFSTVSFSYSSNLTFSSINISVERISLFCSILTTWLPLNNVLSFLPHIIVFCNKVLTTFIHS